MNVPSNATRRPVGKGRINNGANRKRSPYKIKSYSSEVDETLFGTPARYNHQKDTPRIGPDDVSWDPPWVTSPKKTGAPLLWSPFDEKDSKNVNSARKSARAATPRTPTSAKNKYRPKKMVPSYVDETLFGTPRKTHEVRAPWATDDNDKMSPESNEPQVTWSPPLEGANLGTPIRTKKIETKPGVEADSAMHYTPVIKPRLGSTINTPQSQARARSQRNENGSAVSSVQQKLEFCVENGPNNPSEENDAIVQRALKLAGIGQNTERRRHKSNSLDGISSRGSSPGRYFWKKPTSPASSTRIPATGQSGKLSPHLTLEEREKEVDDLFSATGRRVPLSARDSPRRPNSARTSISEISIPGLDYNRPSTRMPRSARSGTSSQSTLLNRPSWKP